MIIRCRRSRILRKRRARPSQRYAEHWRDVVGYEGSYEVSSRGNVWSVRRLTFDGRRVGGYLLKLRPDAHGYRTVCLCVNGVRDDRKVHQLVLEAFVGPRPPGAETLHRNGIRHDNRLSNLLWDTPLANGQMTIDHDRSQRGERHHNHVLTVEDVLDIRQRYAPFGRGGTSGKDLAEEYGVTPSAISNAISGRNWYWLD